MKSSSILKHKLWATLWAFFSRAFILLGLALLAWGITDLPGFTSNSVRLAYIIISILQAATYAGLVYISPPEPPHEHRFDLAIWHAYMYETIMVLAAFGDRRNLLAWEDNMPLRWIGLLVYLVGFFISTWAHYSWIRHLREKGACAVENPVLCYDGLYKWIRYPGMLALTFYCLGFAIAFRSWVGLVLIIALLAGIINRIDNLEKIFSVQYKSTWPIRRHASKRLLPFIY